MKDGRNSKKRFINRKGMGHGVEGSPLLQPVGLRLPVMLQLAKEVEKDVRAYWANGFFGFSLARLRNSFILIMFPK